MHRHAPVLVAALFTIMACGPSDPDLAGNGATSPDGGGGGDGGYDGGGGSPSTHGGGGPCGGTGWEVYVTCRCLCDGIEVFRDGLHLHCEAGGPDGLDPDDVCAGLPGFGAGGGGGDGGASGLGGQGGATPPSFSCMDHSESIICGP